MWTNSLFVETEQVVETFKRGLRPTFNEKTQLWQQPDQDEDASQNVNTTTQQQQQDTNQHEEEEKADASTPTQSGEEKLVTYQSYQYTNIIALGRVSEWEKMSAAVP